MTGQGLFDSDERYESTGAVVAVELINELALDDEPPSAKAAIAVLRDVLAIDPPSLAALRTRDAPGFVGLAGLLHDVFVALDARDVDRAAAKLNVLLAEHPAHPHLAKEGNRWRLHHHPSDAALVPMWTAICAEGLARLIPDHHERLGTCAAPDCERVFLDASKNASRRFCSVTCQNRVKAAAFRRRRSGG